jgi:hypothetical protein
MDIDDKQVESPEVAHIENSDIKKVSVTFATTEEIKVEEDDGSKVIEKEEVVYRAAVTEEKACISETGVPMETVAAPSWASTLNLRNLLDILKAPFTRKS